MQNKRSKNKSEKWKKSNGIEESRKKEEKVKKGNASRHKHKRGVIVKQIIK